MRFFRTVPEPYVHNTLPIYSPQDLKHDLVSSSSASEASETGLPDGVAAQMTMQSLAEKQMDVGDSAARCGNTYTAEWLCILCSTEKSDGARQGPMVMPRSAMYLDGTQPILIDCIRARLSWDRDAYIAEARRKFILSSVLNIAHPHPMHIFQAIGVLL